MTKDRLVRNPKLSAEYSASGIYFFLRKTERFLVRKIQRGWKSDDEIVTEPILRERRAVAVRDLPAWRRNIEYVSARELLRLERRDNRLFFRRSAWIRRRRGRHCLRARRPA